MKDWTPFAILTSIVLGALTLAMWAVSKAQQEDRALIVQLKDNQKIEADILRQEADRP